MCPSFVFVVAVVVVFVVVVLVVLVVLVVFVVVAVVRVAVGVVLFVLVSVAWPALSNISPAPCAVLYSWNHLLHSLSAPKSYICHICCIAKLSCTLLLIYFTAS